MALSGPQLTSAGIPSHRNNLSLDRGRCSGAQWLQVARIPDEGRLLIRVAAMAAGATPGGITRGNQLRQEYLPMSSIQQNEKPISESPDTKQAMVVGFWGVRYQVKDVQRAIA